MNKKGIMKKYLLLIALISFTGISMGQYCSPSYYSLGPTSGAMHRVLLNGYAGSVINDTLPFSSLGTGYTDRSATVGITLQQGRSYTGSLFYYSALSHSGNQVWIDFNNDNVFADSEIVSSVFPYMYSYSSSTINPGFTVNIPATSRTGSFRMRVRNVVYNPGLSPGYGSYILNACTNGDATNQYSYGVTADYAVSVTPLPPCSGIPVAGSAVGVSSICHDTPFDLSLTSDTIAGSLHYQWYSKPVGSGTMAPIAGATSSFYHVGGQSAATEYQLVLTCSASGLHDSSTIHTVAQNPFYGCYCSLSLGGDTSSATIDSFAIAGTGLSINIPHNPNTYIALPDTGAATTTLTKGITYSLFLKSGGTNPYSAHLWIDYNGNGIFDSLEYVTIDTAARASGGTYCNFTVPLTAISGLTGLRIRTVVDSGALNGNRACAYETTGATEDYIVNIAGGSPCGSTPFAGHIYSNVTAICAGTPFVLIGTGYSPVTGLGFQWYSSPAGAGTFTPISGATQALYTVASQVLPTDYKLKITCILTGNNDSTSILHIDENPYYLCNCSPLTGTTLNNDATSTPLDSVSIAGTTLNNTPSGSAVYTSYYPTSPTTTATLSRGTYYTLAVNSHGSAHYNADMWIDFDHNGSFDASEFFSITTNQPTGSPATVSIYIPGTADTGLTAVRIRTSETSMVMSSTDACTDEYYGATQDYVVTIGAGTPCVGAPLAGTCFATASAVCPSEPFTLTNTGSANSLGISYQWVTRVTGSSGYTPLAGASSLTYNIPTQSIGRDYALLVTCAFSGITDTGVIVSVAQNPVYLCYCSPTTGYTLNDDASAAPIDSFAIYPGPLANGTPGSTAVYTEFYPTTGTTTNSMQKGAAYVFTLNSAGTSDYKAGVWIDYDHSGTFDNSEYITLTNGTTAGNTAYASFVIPAGADTGTTGMRVRTYRSSSTPGSGVSCAEYYDGATQDYLVNISQALNCFGTPRAGNALTTVNEVCMGEPFMLISFGYSISNRISYQWLQSPTGAGTYTPISGATNPTYKVGSQSSATDYVMVATCASSGLSDTGIMVTMPMKPGYACYCSPITGTTLNADATPATIDSVAIAGTSINNYTPGDTAVYTQYYPSTSTTTDSLVQGHTYTIYLNSYGSASYDAAIWIDYNQDGAFDVSEYTSVCVNRTPGLAASATFTIPVSADTGLTGFRVRTAKYPFTISSTDGCTDLNFGATEDYIVRIAPGVPCSGVPAVSAAYANASSICIGTSFTLFDTAYPVGVGLSYQWYSRPAGSGSFTAIVGATSPFLTISTQTASTDYRYVTTCSGSGLSSNSNTVTVNQVPFYECYCSSSLGSSYVSSQINNVQVHGSALHVAGTFATTDKVFGIFGDSTGTLQKTLPYPIDLRVMGSSNFDAGMWIDYNHNAVFEPSEYTRLDTNAFPGTMSTTSFTVPAGADTGLTGVRIRATPSYSGLSDSDACRYITNSQTYDFTMRIDTLVRCSSAPAAGTITSSSAFACPSMTLSFANDGYAVGSGISYQWMKSTTGVYASISGATTHALTVSGQTVTTKYILVAHCSFSGTSDTSNVLIITENPFDSCYCSPPTGVTLVSSGGHHDILVTDLVGLSSMSVPEQSPDSTGYVAVPPTPSSYTTTLQRYSSFPVTIYVNYTTYTIAAAGVWVDFNHNSVFDSVEYVPLTQSSDHSHWSGNINVPATSSLGLTGMRVVTKESGTITPSSSCSLISVGQVQDHIINITPAPCYSIGSVTVSGITDSSAIGRWGHIPSSFGYSYVFDTTSSPPAGSGIATTDTFAYSGCIISGRSYYLHVRDSCDAGLVSGWITVPFTTTACAGVSGLAASAVTNTTATISWGTVAGSTGYDYLVDTSAIAATTATGTYVTGGPINLTGLTQGTTYYAHVRSGCHCGNFSDWQTISFTTICDTIAHLHIVGVTDSSVTIRWDSIPHISSYAYVIDTSSGAPSGSGTVVTDTTVIATGLHAGTSYYAHVRHDCSGGYSTWITVPFSTGRCDTVTGLTTIPNSTGFVFYWTAVSGSMGYYYVINSIPAAPTGTIGTYSAVTRDTATGLLSNHTYYIHLRTDCSGGSSGWITVPVTTLICDTVMGINVTSLCDTSATLGWTSTGGAGYLFVVNTTPGNPTVPGTLTSVNIAYLTTLTSSTTYYAHVRNLCSSIDTSAWATLSFTTPTCAAVTGLAASAITNTSATISWVASPCDGGYYYVIDNSSASPSVSGTFTATSSVTDATLTAGTLYYAHVRVYCGGGVYSGWVTIPFTTIDCAPVAGISITSITSNSAQVNWANVSTATAYEYAVDNSATPPASGTVVSSSTLFASVTGLTPSTLYYAHVREDCSGGVVSTWVDSPFNTAALGVQIIDNSAFAVNTFPNPVTEKLTVRVSGGGEGRLLSIADLTGKILLKEKMIGDKMELDMSELTPGVYMLRYEDDAHIQVMKLNKQ